MAIEVYVPQSLTVGEQTIERPILVTYYDLDGDNPSGAITTERPLPEGTKGPLRLEGTRADKTWLVTADEITITSQTAVGFEFTLAASPHREVISEETAHPSAP